MQKPISPPAFHIMAKPTGADCNLNCKYCFFLSKKALYPESNFRMNPDVQRQYIRQYIQSQHASEVNIAWQGGEPTIMGLVFFQRAVRLAQQYKKFGMRINHSIQTNGVLLNDEWCEFFRNNDFLVGLSMDGPQPLHDAFRVDKGGNPTFDRVLKASHLLKDHYVNFNILCTLHAANAEYPLEVYRFFRDEIGAQYIQFIPIIERLQEVSLTNNGLQAKSSLDRFTKEHERPLFHQKGNRVSERSITAAQFGSFLITVFNEWVRNDVSHTFIQLFDVALANWIGAPPGLCSHAETCGNAMALEHNGDLFACDHFVESEYLLGNIKEASLVDLVASPMQRQFGLDKRDRLPHYCKVCPVLFACHGGCPKDRFISTPDGEAGLNYLCAGYRDFFIHIDEAMQFMASELRRGHAPANVMAYMHRKDAERSTTG